MIRRRLAIACFAATALAPLASGGDCAKNYDLVGTQPSSFFGSASCGVGDLDGDGHPDFAVAARYAGPHQEGTVFLYSGADGSLLYSVVGEQSLALFGLVVAGIGDVDQDGRSDFLVSAPQYTEAFTSQGRVYLYSGGNGTLLYTMTGEYTDDFFGSQVVDLGDLDGDQVADFAVSAPQHAPRGRVSFFSGADGTLIRVLDLDNGRSFGRTLAAVDDLDGDGLQDVLIGAYLFNRGTVHVVSSAGPTIAILQGETDGDEFGMVSRLGDLNDDGSGDFIVGAWARSIAYVYSGADLTLLRTLQGETENELFGISLAGPGDLDGDLVEDVLVGATGYFNGRGRAYLLSGADGHLLQLYEGVKQNDFLGTVSAPGDLNGDGVGEFIVGAERADDGGTDAGHAWVYVSGASSWANYGQGHAGTFGVPGFTLSGPPVLGTTITLHIDNSLQLLTTGAILFGLAPAELPTIWDATLLVVPSLVLPITILSSGLSVDVALPDDASLCGVTIYLQAIELDIGASRGLSFTPGVRALLGR